MYRIKQQTPGYYRALRQNRKIMNKRLRKLDAEIADLTGTKQKYSQSKDKIIETISKFKNAKFFHRFLYFITGDIKRLA